jgi:murein tripeptide amidase MpaA
LEEQLHSVQFVVYWFEPMARQRVTITGRDYEAMADLVRRHHITVVLPTVRALPEGRYRVQAVVDPAQLGPLERAGYDIERHEDLEEAGVQRQAEMRASRSRALAERAPGRYLDVEEIEAALASLAGADNSGFTKLIALPHQTWEGRTCHAINIGKGTGAGRIGIYLLGGVHAREWGSPDALIHFVDRLTTAYRTKKGLTLGKKRFTAAQIQSLVNEKDVIVFPQANPDGRHHSMTVEAAWRKNRRPAATTGPHVGCVGVDINRNYDFLWDYTKHFHPDAPVANSINPCDYEVYIGPHPMSEPETKNTVWLLDQNRDIRYFIDIHSYGEMILYNWGDDQNQTKDPAMNFMNAVYDGKRGLSNDRVYGEYMPTADRKVAVRLAKAMRTAIKAVRGRAYTVEQSMSLYPTAGTSDDYAFSRHSANAHAGKVLSFTIEWGRETNQSPFHPPYDEMSRIIEEVTAGLLQFCVQAGS